ncbi:RsmB/NOP family class I SAM-dependent RNA methyltransferase [uncultured Lentibacter sp.]|uniref:RsmB/NOP family class I SAM-dependent RNA methyltransferase n=1 Tax=uncultured Lentibacter sp. TaxID=1659309 RepID=UPI0026325657|nr:RsmB/NOP family class I SAM-dependent RNA methyltransferase [uncultured Lentibacter sp.]
MQPAARVASAAEILDRILAGEPAEKALTTWARGNRFAGSKDRAALRDLVFQALRCLRSYTALGGADAPSGRALMIGALRAEGLDPATVFTGEGHAPAPLSTADASGSRVPQDGAQVCDLPDWLWPQFCASLKDPQGEAALMRQRADVFLRVNTRLASLQSAQAALAEGGIETVPVALSPTALKVTKGARQLRLSAAFAAGFVELQDAASQAVVDFLPLKGAERLLDYCAGGGGKSLALAARTGLAVVAHDAAPERMKDIAARAARAKAQITVLTSAALARQALFDMVLCDAPCSGSGAWRRAPEGKWRLTEARLQELGQIQRSILAEAQSRVAPGGRLAYVTCSLLRAENEDICTEFEANFPEWRREKEARWLPSFGADGFFCAIFGRKTG